MISLIDGAIEDFFREEASLSVADISFQIPTKAWSSGLEKAPINLYLFDIRENTELRKNEWETVTRSDSTVTQQKPPARVDLFYMITAYSDKEKNAKIFEEHQLLSRMLAVVHNFAFIPEDPYLIDNLPGISPIPKIPIEAVHPKFLDEQGGFQLWSAIDQFLKPAVYIKVTVPIELHRTVEHQMVLAKVTKYVTVSETFVQLGGIVTDSAVEPAPVSGAEMRLLNSSGKEVDRKRTDEIGKFLFRNVADGTYTIAVDAAGFQMKEVVIGQASEAGKAQLIIQLETT